MIRTEFYHRHKEKKAPEWAAKQREWDAKHPGRKNELHRIWYNTYPEQAKAHNQKRRARKQKVPGTLTAEEIQMKLKAQNYACYYCSVKFKKRKNGTYKYELEHTIPISRAECNPRHDVNFVVLSCRPCNESKKDKLPHEWAKGGRLF